MDSRSGFERSSEGANSIQTKRIFCGGVNHSVEKRFERVRQEK